MGLSSFPETEISVSGIVPSIMDSIQIRLRTFHVVRSETIWKISNTKQMLKGIRVESKEELERRLYLYFDEVNREPVVYHWSYRMDEISVAEAVEAGVKTNEVCVS